ncbi:MAG: type II toxin-antitoxin system RelE/ParE family toxin [Chloroflexi bacterium]|nr:type II toxin-antitoxin system RelE/ParE family toxin [Chloroflexota bacterium]
MDVEFADDDLARVETEATATAGMSQALVKAFRRRVQSIRAAPDERQFYANRGMRFEKLEGKRKHQHSMRLNDQYRLIVELVGKGSEKILKVVAVEDYH